MMQPDSLTDQPALTYRKVVEYLYANGWVREEEGSGWFWKDGGEEATIGGALEQQLQEDNLDTRDEPPGLKSPGYWG